MKTQEILNYYRAGYPCLALETKELDRVIQQLKQIFAEPIGEKKVIPKIRIWDLARNEMLGEGGSKEKAGATQNPALYPVDYLNQQEGYTIVVAPLLNRYFQVPHLISAMTSAIPVWRGMHKMMIILGSGIELPPELRPLVFNSEIDLPTAEELDLVIRSVGDSKKLTPCAGLADAARGLTLFETENITAKNIIEKGTISAEAMWEGKEQILKQAAGLRLLKTTRNIKDLKGLENLKDFVLKMAPNPESKGVIVVGHPGTGKTHFCTVIGQAIGLETIEKDVGSDLNRFVGGTEENVARTKAVLKAVGRSVLVLDEVEKMFSGVESSGVTDGGVGARLYRSYLQMLEELPHYVVATANDISGLPPAFIRSERWDAIFFVDFPAEEEREQIIEYYKKQYKVPKIGQLPAMVDWTGAEIKTLFRLASIGKMTAQEASRFVNPISRIHKEKIEKMREWARTTCVPAAKVSTQENKRTIIE